MKNSPVLRSTLAVGLFLAVLPGCSVIDRLTGSDGFAIQQFKLDQQTVAPGTSVTLSWDVEGAESVEIDNGVGHVSARGSKQLRPETSTTYTLTARSGSSMATASVQVTIRGAFTPAPLPAPTPTVPPPTPAPSPSPSPSPGFTGGDSTDKVPPATPPPSCGTPAPASGGCALRVIKGALTGSECIELTALSLERECPVAFATPRQISFDVTAKVSASNALTWRRARASSDVLTPATGTLERQGTTTVSVDDLALSDALVIEIAEGDRILMTFSVRHN